ncbi:MAG: PAS domain S-box protein [Deltaproteobacteria bacterium]|nr:PAS domain S-box protein [Deltaproteobacteria bacterium]
MAREPSEKKWEKEAFDKGPSDKALGKIEDYYQRLFEQSNDAIIVHETGRIVDANQRACQMLGYTKEQLISMEIRDLHPEEGRRESRKRLKASLKKESTSFETQFMTADGGRVEVEISSRMIDKDSKLVHGIIRDITRRKKAEEALRESEERYGSILESMSDVYYRTDLEGNLLMTNPAGLNLLGYDRMEDVMGRNIARDFYKNPEQRKSVMTKLMKQGKIRNAEVTLRKKDGAAVVVETNSHLVYDKNGRPVAIEGTVRDRTERKMAEEALQKAHEMLELRVEDRTAALIEANTALKVLLKKRDEDREELQEKVFVNIRQLIQPYIEKLRGKIADERQRNILDILDSNLKDIVSPFSTTLSSKYLCLTPTEIQVANLVKHGKSAKETADLLNISRRTIEVHRANIRKKLGIRGQKANLRTHLLSLQ